MDFPAEFYKSIVEASPYGIILIMVFSMFVIMYKIGIKSIHKSSMEAIKAVVI